MVTGRIFHFTLQAAFQSAGASLLNDYKVSTEYEVIKGCIREDAKCQRMLFKQYAGKMMTVRLRYAQDTMEAEDILQDAFVKVFKFIHQYKFEGSFEGWLRRVFVTTALRSLEKKKISFTEITYNNDTTALEPYAYSSLGQHDILKLIEALPEGYRVVFNLNVIEGYSHEEIATLLKIQPATSRSQLVKARKMLQNKIVELQKIAV